MAGRRGNNEGSVYQRKDGIWVAAISLGRDPATGKPQRRVAYGSTRKEAAEKLQQLQKVAASNTPQARKDVTVKDLAKEYLEHKKRSWKPRTYVSAESVFRLHVEPYIGEVRLLDLTARAVSVWLRKLPESRSAQLARQYLYSACELAMRWEWLERNPVAITERVKTTRKKPADTSASQIQSVLEATKTNRYHAAVCLMVGCGLRISEAMGLTWEDVDMEAGLVSVSKQLQAVSGYEVVLAPLKTSSSRRTCQMPQFAIEALKVHKLAQAAERADRLARGLEWENKWGLVFTGLRGQPSRSNVTNQSIGRDLRSAGITGLTPHHLRHAFASFLIDAQVPITEVADALGHSGPSVTMQVYAHKLAGKPKRTGAIMEGILGKPTQVATETTTEPPGEGGS
jgi:integrase